MAHTAQSVPETEPICQTKISAFREIRDRQTESSRRGLHVAEMQGLPVTRFGRFFALRMRMDGLQFTK